MSLTNIWMSALEVELCPPLCTRYRCDLPHLMIRASGHQDVRRQARVMMRVEWVLCLSTLIVNLTQPRIIQKERLGEGLGRSSWHPAGMSMGDCLDFTLIGVARPSPLWVEPFPRRDP